MQAPLAELSSLSTLPSLYVDLCVQYSPSMTHKSDWIRTTFNDFIITKLITSSMT